METFKTYRLSKPMTKHKDGILLIKTRERIFFLIVAFLFILSSFGCSASTPPCGTYYDGCLTFMTFTADGEFICSTLCSTFDYDTRAFSIGESILYKGTFFMRGKNVICIDADGSRSDENLLYDEEKDQLLINGEVVYWRK